VAVKSGVAIPCTLRYSAITHIQGPCGTDNGRAGYPRIEMDKTLKCVSVYCDPVLHAWIKELAEAEGRSMSQWVARRLDAARVKLQTPPPQKETRT